MTNLMKEVITPEEDLDAQNKSDTLQESVTEVEVTEVDLSGSSSNTSTPIRHSALTNTE